MNDEKNTKELMAELTSHRAEIALCKGERQAVESLAVPVEVVISAKEKEIDSVLESLCDPEYDIRRSDVESLLIGIFCDQLKKNLAQNMRSSWPERVATGEQKKDRIAELASKLLEIEEAEERVVCELEAADVPVIRRPDINVGVFFEVLEKEK